MAREGQRESDVVTRASVPTTVRPRALRGRLRVNCVGSGRRSMHMTCGSPHAALGIFVPTRWIPICHFICVVILPCSPSTGVYGRTRETAIESNSSALFGTANRSRSKLAWRNTQFSKTEQNSFEDKETIIVSSRAAPCNAQFDIRNLQRSTQLQKETEKREKRQRARIRLFRCPHKVR